MAVAQQPDTFSHAYLEANLSYSQLPVNGCGTSSADASLAANDSSASLVDPLLDNDGAGQHERLRDAETVQYKASNAQEQTRKAGQKPTKSVAPIRIPRKSDTDQQQQMDGLRTPASGLSSAALTSSFPMPPPRTPASSSSPAGTFGSPALSAHGHSHQTDVSTVAVTRSSSPLDSVNRLSPVTRRNSILPRKLLSVPPPTPAFSNSRASTSLGLYWEGETSSIRNSGSHPAPTATLPYYSADPAAYVHTPIEEEPHARIKSFAAEYSMLPPSGSVSPVAPSYPPRAYSPAGSSILSGTSKVIAGSHRSLGNGSPGAQPSRPLLHRSRSEHLEDVHTRNKRRESSGTFGTIFSSPPSVGPHRPINVFENDDIASSGSRTTTHTRTHSEVSVVSSAGMTHELVRRGNVFEALPSGAQEASRRLARASLVSSELLRSAHSVDALRSVLAEDSAYTVDRKDSDTGDQFASRKHHSYRYSSGPAPTLASLVEDDDDLDLPPANMDYTKAKQRKSRHRNSGKRPYDRMPHRNSDWGSKSSKSYTSHRSGKSSAQFTVASHAPSLPTLHNTNIRAQIADKEATLPFTKLARRASTLGEILDNKPEQKRYISYPIDENGPLHEYDELRELRYSNQLRKARRKMEVGLPTLWNSHTPAGSVASRERLDNAAFRLKHNTVSTENQYHVHPNVSLEERHFRRRKSYPASQLQEIMSTRSEKPSSSDLYGRSSFSSSGSGTDDDHAPPPKKITYWQTLPPQKKRKLRLAAFLLLSLVIAAVIGIAVPLSKGSSARAVDCKRTCSSQRTPVFRNGVCMCQCSGNRGGPFCDLDATCVCPDGSDACSNRLAKSLLSATSTAAALFAPPINTTRLAAALSESQIISSNDCSAQLRLLETPNLDPTQYKARRRWTHAVLLWDAAISEDFTDTTLSTFQAGLSYWQWQDSPSFEAQAAFQIQIHGYSIDFAYQKVFVPPKGLSEIGVSQASIARLGNTSTSALQRMGAFALAASTQRSSALSSLFLRMGFQAEQLRTFRANILASPVYFPFDLNARLGSQSAISAAFRSKDGGTSFPIPAACISGLSTTQLAEVNRVEADIFGLPAATALSEVSTNCTERPIYGFLNVLNLRLPFSDGGRPHQAIVMADETRKSRLTFLAGASLLPLSYSEEVNTSAISTASYGTVAAIDNVLFDFLSLLGDAAMVRAFITYVLSGDRTPPSSASSLGNLLGSSLQSLPLIEVQAWGGLLFSDIDYIVSGISQAGDIALFGSDAGAQLRQWAHSGPNSKVVRWSADAMSSQYALDGGNDAVFQAVWDKSRSLSPTAILNELASSRLLTS